MTGPEHYREAERLVKDEYRTAESIAAAQVHATLALAAAQSAPAAVVPLLETAPAVAYVYRAEWGMTRLGTYTNAEAARKHCEDDARNHNPGSVSFDWLGDESEPDAPYELAVTLDGDEQPTEYTVTRIEVAAEYDPEADA